MSTSTIREFLVGLGFKVDEAGMSKFEGALLSATGVALALGTAVTTAAAAVLAGVKSIAAEYDELDKLATRFHTTVDAIDEFNDIGGLLGLSNEQTIGSLTALDRAVNDTALGLGRAKKVFEEIGLEVTDAAGKVKPITTVMDELQAKLAGFERGKQIRIMERLGLDPALIKLFNADLVDLRADLEAIDKAAGFDLSEAVGNSKTFMKAWKALQLEFNKSKLVFEKMYESIAVKLMPALTAAINNFRRRIEQFRKLVMENLDGVRKVLTAIVEFILGVFTIAWRLFGRVLDLAVESIGKVINWFKALDPVMAQILLGVTALYLAWRLLNLSFLASPITWVLALGAALLLLYDDFKTWQEGGESLIDWGKWKDEIKIVTDALESFQEIAKSIFTVIFASVDMLAKLLSGDFAGAWRAAGAAMEEFFNIGDRLLKLMPKLTPAGIIGNGVGNWISDKAGQVFGGAAASTSAGVASMSADPFGTQAILGASGGAAPQATLNQQTTINVAGGDAASTGRAVAGEQSRVNADGVRNLKGSVR